MDSPKQKFSNSYRKVCFIVQPLKRAVSSRGIILAQEANGTHKVQNQQ